METIALTKALELVGRAKYPSNWNKRELGGTPIIPFSEAQALSDKKRVLIEELKDKGIQLSDADINRMVAMDEHTGDLLSDMEDERVGIGSGPDGVSKLIVQIYHLISQLDELPPLDDPTRYKEIFDTFMRQQETKRLLIHEFKQGVLVAYYSGSESLEQVPQDRWSARNCDVNFINNSARLGSKHFTSLCVPSKQLNTIITKLAKSSGGQFNPENQALLELKSLMEFGQQKAKSAIFDNLKDTIPRLSRRAFDRAWVNACTETNSGWDKPGRPRATYHY